MSLKKASVFSLVLLLILVVSGCDRRVYASLEGDQISLDSYRGSWLLINYWAVWCKPCVEEIPELNHLNQVEDKRIAVLGVNYDSLEPEQLLVQAKKLNIKFPILLEDPAEHLGIARPQVLPATIMVSPEGEVAKVLIGPQTVETIRTFIEKSDQIR